MKYSCPCCGYYTFENRPDGSYDICPVCFWEDDPIQLKNPDYEGGANRLSLNQARKNFLEFRACEKEMIVFTRKPNSDEMQELEGCKTKWDL